MVHDQLPATCDIRHFFENEGSVWVDDESRAAIDSIIIGHACNERDLGSVQIRFNGCLRTVQVTLTPDDAIELARAMKRYARETKRDRAEKRFETEECKTHPPGDSALKDLPGAKCPGCGRYRCQYYLSGGQKMWLCDTCRESRPVRQPGVASFTHAGNGGNGDLRK
jgi:hypothetical protein